MSSSNSNSSFSFVIPSEEESRRAPSMEITIVERYNTSTRLSTTIDGSYQLHYACPSTSSLNGSSKVVGQQE
ncbi:expressed unknown protein [Seminavis robusta]|uniref:Uncharacterized protein n=1 Tax=Seminavis robusta TaxID=568900 RepID=A0A9N8EN25_9STRA|nr:expressed unknown protein [Seminavis robusta]|eukprot:Sro1403_g269670.1 n/a (72) ;mRNA; r:13083-13298